MNEVAWVLGISPNSTLVSLLSLHYCSSILKLKMKKTIFRNFCRIDIKISQFDKQHLTIDLAKFDDICAKRNVFMGAQSKPYSSLHNPLTYMVCLHSIKFINTKIKLIQYAHV